MPETRVVGKNAKNAEHRHSAIMVSVIPEASADESFDMSELENAIARACECSLTHSVAFIRTLFTHTAAHDVVDAAQLWWPQHESARDSYHSACLCCCWLYKPCWCGAACVLKNHAASLLPMTSLR